MVIVQKLFPLLPDGFVAAPGVHLGAMFEIDVSAYEQDERDAAPMSGVTLRERRRWRWPPTRHRNPR